MHKTETYRQLIEELLNIRTAESDIVDMLREYPLDHVTDRDTFESSVRARLDVVRLGTTDRAIRAALFKLGCAGLVCAVGPGYDRYLLNAPLVRARPEDCG